LIVTAASDYVTGDSVIVTGDSELGQKLVTIRSERAVTAPESPVTSFSESAVTIRRNPQTISRQCRVICTVSGCSY
jgi:hypothetical protein